MLQDQRCHSPHLHYRDAAPRRAPCDVSEARLCDNAQPQVSMRGSVIVAMVAFRNGLPNRQAARIEASMLVTVAIACGITGMINYKMGGLGCGT